MADMDDDDLLEALGVEAAPSKASSHTAQQERLIAGFEDILRFVEANGRAPQHGEDRDIFERVPDISKARAVLGYEPTYSLEYGLQRMFEYGAVAPTWTR